MPYGYRRRTNYGGMRRSYGRSSGFARSVRRITKAQHLRDTETKKTVVFNQNLFVGIAPYEAWAQPTFAYVAPVGPVANELLQGEEFMNARVKEVATISVNWLNMAANLGVVQPITVTRYILALNNALTAVYNPPTPTPYTAVSVPQLQFHFQNVPSNSNRWVVETENCTVVQKKKWRFNPPNFYNTVEDVTSVSSRVVKPGKFFKGKKEFEGTQGSGGTVTGNVALKGWQFWTVWIYHFDQPVSPSTSAPFIDVVIDNYTYFKDP